MQYKITVDRAGNVSELSAAAGEKLIDALAKAGISVYAPCGGHGICSKCKAIVTGAGELSAHEREMLAESELASGWRLLCALHVTGDMSVKLPEHKAQILVDALSDELMSNVDSGIIKEDIELPEPSLADSRSDSTRLASRLSGIHLTLAQLQALPSILRDCDFKLEAIRYGDMLLKLGQPGGGAYGIAVDIGTTTMAAYLVDICGDKARVAGVASALNPQRAYGGDVITRSDYASHSDANRLEMRKLVVDQIGELALALTSQAGVSTDRIFKVIAVGNTTMMHMLLGLDTRNIAVSPFVPVYSQGLTVRAEEIDLALPAAVVSACPCVAGYVGADAVAAALHCDMDVNSGITLMVDIGTNGEIVLGNAEKLLCCSTAAGPALEGAHISCGMGGVKGAISAAELNGSEFRIQVIGGGKPTGICGSGLVDIIATLLDAGVIDEMGTLDFDGHESLCTEVGGREAVRIAEGELGEIVLTQRDIREVQLAKAAIAAGIGTLIKERGGELGDIEALYIAGGFGNYIRRESAARIGLLPRELLECMKPVGNAAGLGAQQLLISRNMQQRAERIAGDMRYVELSARADFQDLFVDMMLFE